MTSAGRNEGARSALHSTGLVAAGMALFSIGSYVFFLLAGRRLGPDDYGLVAALQGIIIILAMPCTAPQWAIARLIASSPGEARGEAVAMYRWSVIAGAWLSIVIAALASLATVALAGMVDGLPVGALIATYVAAAPLIPLMLGIGALQGEQRYLGYAVSYGLSGITRVPIFVGLLVLPIGGVEAAMFATAASFVVGALTAAWLTRADLRTRSAPSRSTRHAFARPLIASVIGLAGIASMINLDVVAAKIGLGGDDAGYFGAASLIAKALLLVPLALTVLLLPRVTERVRAGRPTGPLLATGVGTTLAAGIVAFLASLVLSGPAITITFGQAYAPGSTLIPPFIAATTLLGMLLILVNHHVARDDHRFVWTVGGLAIVHIVLLLVMSGSAMGIIAADAITAGLGLAIHEALYWRSGDSIIRAMGHQAGLLRARMGRG